MRCRPAWAAPASSSRIEWAGITPDIMATAKGLGGGFPIGACLMTEAVGSAMTAGSHGSTFGGNPLAMAVGNAVLDVVLEDGFLDHVANMGLRLKQRLAALKDEHGEIIEEVRGQGLMLGLKCKLPNQKLLEALAREEDAERASRRQCRAPAAAVDRRRGGDRARRDHARCTLASRSSVTRSPTLSPSLPHRRTAMPLKPPPSISSISTHWTARRCAPSSISPRRSSARAACRRA